MSLRRLDNNRFGPLIAYCRVCNWTCAGDETRVRTAEAAHRCPAPPDPESETR